MIILARVPSSRDPGVLYEVSEDDGIITCTCPGFKFRSACKHLDEVVSRKVLDDGRRSDESSDSKILSILDSATRSP